MEVGSARRAGLEKRFIDGSFVVINGGGKARAGTSVPTGEKNVKEGGSRGETGELGNTAGYGKSPDKTHVRLVRVRFVVQGAYRLFFRASTVRRSSSRLDRQASSFRQ